MGRYPWYQIKIKEFFSEDGEVDAGQTKAAYATEQSCADALLGMGL
jgi:hypothetical protein